MEGAGWEQEALGKRGCRVAPRQGHERAGSQPGFLCWIISFQHFYCNYRYI